MSLGQAALQCVICALLLLRSRAIIVGGVEVSDAMRQIILIGLIVAASVAVTAAIILILTRRTIAAADTAHTRRLGQEVTAHRQTHDKLEQAKEIAEAANAAKTRYLVAVSHEIRSPLNAIYGYAQLLEREDTIPPSEAGGVIRRSAEHLTNLVEGLLDISRIESGVLELRRDIVRLPALLDQVVEMFQMQAATKNLTLDYVVDGRLPRFVRADEKRLRQILINLLSNAIKYTQAGGATMTVRYRSQTAVIDVTDTGIGIAPEDLDRIFEPFERGASPDAAMQPGIGLGLAITRVLARILGGEITVSSEVGKGSSFRLHMLLPEPMEPPAGAPTHDRVIGYDGVPRKILMIDDNQSQLTVVQRLLRPLHFDVAVASDGEAGLALAARTQPDLVLLDIQMPDCDGWDVARMLRASYGRALKIVMVSANAHEFRVGGDGASDHDAFLTKPVELDALLDVIGRQLELRWIAGMTQDALSAIAPPAARLDATAQPYLADMRRHLQVGHVSAIARSLSDLEVNVPGSAATVAGMRRLLEEFDLRALARRIDDVG